MEIASCGIKLIVLLHFWFAQYHVFDSPQANRVVNIDIMYLLVFAADTSE